MILGHAGATVSCCALDWREPLPPSCAPSAAQCNDVLLAVDLGYDGTLFSAFWRTAAALCNRSGPPTTLVLAVPDRREEGGATLRCDQMAARKATLIRLFCFYARPRLLASALPRGRATSQTTLCSTMPGG